MFEKAIPFWAVETPDKPAVWSGRDIGYRRFDRDIGVAAALLAQAGWAPRRTILLHVRRVAFAWLLTLAFERLGHLVTVAAAEPDQLALIRPDVVVTDEADLEIDPGISLYRIDKTFMSAFASGEPLPASERSPALPEDPVIILVSSGTTGGPKKVVLTRAMIDHRLQTVAQIDAAATRHCVTMGLATIGGFIFPMMAWFKGAAAVMAATLTEDAMTRGRPDLFMMSPAQLHRVLALSPTTFTAQPKVKIYLTGSATPPPLGHRIEQRGGAELHNLYGSTENGWVTVGSFDFCSRRFGTTGHVTPGAHVKIVSAEGEAAAPGEAGEVWIKTAGMALSYLDNPAATAANFKDGWFRSGDYGFVADGGVLVVEGRIDDIVNVGGVKVAATGVEHAALECAGVLDAGALALPMSSGNTQLFCAVVDGGGADADQIAKHLYDRHKVGIRVMVVPLIPRNAMGKIQRNLLRTEIMQAETTLGRAPEERRASV